MGLYYNGTVIQWDCDTVGLWYSGTVTLGHFRIIELWRRSRAVEWRGMLHCVCYVVLLWWCCYTVENCELTSPPNLHISTILPHPSTHTHRCIQTRAYKHTRRCVCHAETRSTTRFHYRVDCVCFTWVCRSDRRFAGEPVWVVFSHWRNTHTRAYTLTRSHAHTRTALPPTWIAPTKISRLSSAAPGALNACVFS